MNDQRIDSIVNNFYVTKQAVEGLTYHLTRDDTPGLDELPITGYERLLLAQRLLKGALVVMRPVETPAGDIEPLSEKLDVVYSRLSRVINE